MSARTLKFKLGELDLTLVPALTAADVKRMASFNDPEYRRTHADETYEMLLELLVKCAREHRPKLTNEEIEDQLDADNYAERLSAVTIVLHQLAGVYPQEEN